MASRILPSMANLFAFIFLVLIIHHIHCYPQKRELNNFPKVINILVDGRNEQLTQTQILRNISTALRQDESSNILQEQSSSMETVTSILASQSQILANLNTLASGNRDLLANQNELLENISISLVMLTKSSPVTARDCSDIASQGPYVSGPYTISPWDGASPFTVYCDLESSNDENSWIVIQKRFDGSVDFDLGWEEYKNGFGDLEGEFWLGLNKMYRLTRTGGPWQLRIELEDFGGNTAYAQYDNFAVGSEATHFQLISIGQYIGNAGNSLSSDVGQAFTTKDRDNDSWSNNCSAEHGAFWLNNCGHVSLNGLYRTSEISTWNGIVWNGWKGSKTLKSSTMMIKPNRQ